MTKKHAAAASHSAAAASRGHVPWFVPWSISFLIPILVAIVNHLMVILDLTFIGWKFENAKAAMESGGLAVGTFALIGMSVLFGSTAAILVAVLAPTCAGSGIPEVLGFLNGNELPGLFALRSSSIRVIAIVLAQSAGFPIGREGPMIAIGGSIGFGVAHVLLRPSEKRSEKVVSEIDDFTGETCLATSSMIATQERFANARRIGCALGAAAGIATAFNSPIGGILYMCEEASVSGLMPKFHIFTGTVIGSFVARALLKVTNMDVHRLVIYEDSYLNQGQSWDWVDMPVIMLLAALLGAAGGFNANACCRVWKARAVVAKKLIKRQPYAKMGECIFWCTVCSCFCSVMPALVACTDNDIGHAKESGTAEHHRRLESSLNLVRHICPEGQHNQAATLLLQGAEGAVKHLYSHAEASLSIGPLVTTLITYSVLAVGMPGLCVPMGLFIPNMLMGGLAGRLVGEIVNTVFNSLGIVSMPAGVYAVVGSAAMLAGFTHMTVGIVALLTEAINDLSLIMPLMLVVSIARYVSTFVAHHGYDEQVIIKKGVPFLDTEIPKEVEASCLTARDVCYAPPKDVLLPCRAKVKTIKRALRHTETNYFPIVSEDGNCVGLTNRGRLKSVLKAVRDAKPRSSQLCIVPSATSDSGEHDFARQTSNNTVSGSILSSFSLSPSGTPEHFRKSVRRKSEGRMLGDQHVERRLRFAIMDLFADPQNLRARDDDDAEEYDEDLLPIERVMDPAPYMISEAMPIQRFYALFNDVSVNVVCVLSRRGTFFGIITRRGLIDVASHLHGPHEKEAPSTGSAVQPMPHSQAEGDIEDQDMPPVITVDEHNFKFSFKHANPGGIVTPSDTDAGSQYQESDSLFDDDIGDDESQHSPRVVGTPLFMRGGMSSRNHSKTSNGSSHTASSHSPDSYASNHSPHSRSGTANNLADMLGPTELRAQLASAWSRLAASEQEAETLRKKLSSMERNRSEKKVDEKGEQEGKQDEEQDEEEKESEEEDQEKESKDHPENNLEEHHGQADCKKDVQQAPEEHRQTAGVDSNEQVKNCPKLETLGGTGKTPDGREPSGRQATSSGAASSSTGAPSSAPGAADASSERCMGSTLS